MYDFTHKRVHTHRYAQTSKLLGWLCQMLGPFSVTNLFSKGLENIQKCEACLLPVTVVGPQANSITPQMSHL